MGKRERIAWWDVYVIVQMLWDAFGWNLELYK